MTWGMGFIYLWDCITKDYGGQLVGDKGWGPSLSFAGFEKCRQPLGGESGLQLTARENEALRPTGTGPESFQQA